LYTPGTVGVQVYVGVVEVKVVVTSAASVISHVYRTIPTLSVEPVAFSR
jgi:hypothetical protein